MKKILVVVDYQNDFVTGALGFAGAELLDEGIANKVRKYGVGKVYYTLDTHYPNYLETREGETLPIEHCIINTEGHKSYGETGKSLDEVEAKGVTKVTFGISPGDMLTMGLPLPIDVETVEIVGLVTNMCVISTAVVFQARYPEAQIIVDASLCASFDNDLHEKTLDVMEGMQIQVINRGVK